jgi:biopolymer transport protein ExbD
MNSNMATSASEPIRTAMPAPESPGIPPRRRRRRSGSEPQSIGLTLAPMIDMSFTFLIFFVVTTRFMLPEGILSSTMPRQGSAAAAVALPFSPIVVRIGWAGPGDDDYKIRVDRFANAPARFADLPEFLRGIQSEPGFDKDTPLVIVADDDVRWDHVVGCWNAALLAGCKNIAFAAP